MKGFRVPEWGKNLLILGLSLSAVYLFTLSPLYLNSPLRGWTSRMLPVGDGTAVSVSLTAAARPTAMAVTSSAGRYGLQYDTAAVDALFDQTGGLLGEALGSAGAPVAVPEWRWRGALGDEGVYFDFSGVIPFSALAGWLGDGERNDQLSGDVRRLVLAPGEDGAVWLYYQDGRDPGVFRACATALKVDSHLTPLVTAFAPNGASFAFEEEALALCYPYTLIAGGTTSAAVYTASSPLAAGGEALKQALSALSFSGALVTSYAVDGGTVYRVGEDSLLAGRDGSLTYYGTDGSLYPVASEGSAPTLAEMIETTRRMVASVVEPVCGDARLYLISASEEGGDTVITYGYSLNGAQVWTGNGGWAAQFTLTDGLLAGFTVYPRCYTATGGGTPLLPAAQAAAAMEARGAGGSELLLVYRDAGGEHVLAGWAAV